MALRKPQILDATEAVSVFILIYKWLNLEGSSLLAGERLDGIVG
jgi:hypothetical protein